MLPWHHYQVTKIKTKYVQFKVTKYTTEPKVICLYENMLNKQKNYVVLNIFTLEFQANRILSFIGVKIFSTVAFITLKLALKVHNV